MKEQTLMSGEELWQAVARRLPQLSSEEQRTGIVLLRELARGEAVGTPQIARALGTPAGEVEARLKESALSPFVHMDHAGSIVGFWGLSTVRTHHRLTLNGRALWTWCAYDSLFLPELLGETAHVESRDPQSDDLIQLTITPTRIESVEPKGVVLSMNSPEVWELSSAGRVMASACHFIFFFASRASGERWVANHARTVLLSLDEAFEYGRQQNVRMFGSALVPRNG
ncbi:MAG: organomercurial lyase [Vicinamibacteraceae bacterium]